MSGEFRLLIARLIADPQDLSEKLEVAKEDLARHGLRLAMAEMLDFCGNVLELELPEGDPALLRTLLDKHFTPSDLLVAERDIAIPHVFVSDMDSTIISAECIDELADFAGIKPQIAAITERAMQGELDFESALRERVSLLRDLPESAIAECLETRIAAMPGAGTLVATLKEKGCRTVLVTGGFHQFADPVAGQLGFERVVANRLEVDQGVLTGGLVGSITDSGVKKAVLLEEMESLGAWAVSLAAGDGANDIPMLEAATFGMAFRAKPKARAASDGWIDRGDLTSILQLLGIPSADWVTR
ncbi:MAG: phosphoserine phosphatase SerB [Novosphingobium sp.]